MDSKKKNIILESRNLTVGYVKKTGNLIIADTVNFSIEKGELVGLV